MNNETKYNDFFVVSLKYIIKNYIEIKWNIYEKTWSTAINVHC